MIEKDIKANADMRKTNLYSSFRHYAFFRNNGKLQLARRKQECSFERLQNVTNFNLGVNRNS